MYKMHSRTFKAAKIKKHGKTQKQRNSERTCIKHQSETKDTLKREIYELKMTTQNITVVQQRYGKISEKRNPGNKKSL
jgi:hypothetical protein